MSCIGSDFIVEADGGVALSQILFGKGIGGIHGGGTPNRDRIVVLAWDLDWWSRACLYSVLTLIRGIVGRAMRLMAVDIGKFGRGVSLL